MNTSFFKKIQLIVFIAFLSGLVNAKTEIYNIVHANNPKIQYTGRIDFSKPLSPKITWPGTYIKANFTGSFLALTLDDQKGQNYFNVIVDNNIDNPVILNCEKGEKIYFITNGLNDSTHSLWLFKRTEGEEGYTLFKNLILNQNGNLIEPPARPPLKIELIGDSITCGMSNEAYGKKPGEGAAVKNNFLTYGAITARDLNADFTCIAKSGIGIMISWFNFTMPDYFNQLDATGTNGQKWDFKKWQPDVVVINLFQNDSWLVNRLKPVPTDEQRVQAYYNFLKTVRGKYPKAFIICTLGSMDATKPGSKWPGYISKAVSEFREKNSDNKIDTLFFDYTGFNPHPLVKDHKRNAKKLTKFIREKVLSIK
ncbi:MAG: electron transporter RnfD [Chlamydiae bacterium]|nr:MAG: electron transporter RnfD [Chlamydiota bacterium]